MSLYHQSDCGHSVEYGSSCQQCEWNETTKTIENLRVELAKEKEENSILYKDRNEAFKLWDDHKYKVSLAIKTMEDILSGWNTNGDFYDFLVEDALKKLKE